MNKFDGKNSTHVLELSEVELGVNYALVISTNAGLWRYIIGDTIRFTSKFPFRFKITGRTKSFINAFGEELIVENAEEAIRAVCIKCNCTVVEYTAGPIYMDEKSSAGHEWIVEFSSPFQDLEKFSACLDFELKNLNSDYEAKRTGDISMKPPLVKSGKKGLFDKWLKEKGKLGGQHKVPRLANDRVIIEELYKLDAGLL